MEASRLTMSGENVDQLAETLIESKATTSARSLNKRGARNVHRYDGDGFTQYTYERAEIGRASCRERVCLYV